MKRRTFLGAILAAPAVVHAENLMRWRVIDRIAVPVIEVPIRVLLIPYIKGPDVPTCYWMGPKDLVVPRPSQFSFITLTGTEIEGLSHDEIRTLARERIAEIQSA